MLTSAVAMAWMPTEAAAQRRPQAQNLDRVLILPPLPGDRTADSAYALAFADEVRKRLAGRVRNQYRVVETEQYCEALEASGFDCGTLLDDNSAVQLARFLSADAYIVSDMERDGGAPVVHVRLVDMGRSGLSGWVHARGTPGIEAKAFAEMVGDSLRDHARAAREAKECSLRRDRSDFRGARERAERAFERYPNHPSAAMCASYLFEAQQFGADSLIWAYQKAVAGDSLLVRGWERLGQQQIMKGDTAAAIQSFIGKLNADPADEEFRRGIIAQMFLLGDIEGALELARGGLEVNPGSVEIMRLVAQGCTDNEEWSCVVEWLAMWHGVNPELGADTVFLARIIGGARFANDTAAGMQWTGVAVENFPDSPAYLMAHGSALKDGGMPDSALMVYDRVREVDPDNVRAPLAATQIVLDGIAIDSVTPLDSAALTHADSMLTFVAERSPDDQATLASVGALYYQPGQRLAALRLHPRLAAGWLARSLEFPLDGRLVPVANFFLGFSSVFYLSELFAETQAAETCEAVDAYEAQVVRGKQALEAGRSVSERAVEQLMPQYENFESVIPQFRAAWECATPSG